MSTSEANDKATREHLQRIAEEIRDYQTRHQLTDTALVKKFKGLGSTKTFKRICTGDMEDLSADRWLSDYRQVKSLIEALNGSETEEEPLYDDLTTCSRVRVAVIDAMKEKGNARLVVIQGGSGSGKTFSIRALVARFGDRIVLGEADETWKESVPRMLGSLLVTFGVENPPKKTEDRLTKLLTIAQTREHVLVIDEAHHLGPTTLNVIKTLLNRCPKLVIVLAAMDTLFRRLEFGAYEEARQLTQNRLCERIILSELCAADVEAFLGGRLQWENGDLKKAIACTLTAAKDRGQFAFIKAVVRQARSMHGKRPLTLDDWTNALSKTIGKR